MTRPRPRIAESPATADLDEGVTIARAAQLLGCDPSTVRRLLRQGSLQGWRIAACASRQGEPRVSTASIRAWRDTHAIAADVDAPDKAVPRAKPERRLHGAHRESVAYLQKLGIR
jgi:transposase-like protein